MAEKETKKKVKRDPGPLMGAHVQPTILKTDAQVGADLDKTFIDNIIETGINGGLNIAELENFTSMSNSREMMYQLIDTMAKDASVAAIVRTYAENVCETNEAGHIVWAESDDPAISKFVNYLLNIMNVDKYIFSWACCLIKYGDVYLRLYRESDYEDKLFKKDHILNGPETYFRSSLHEELEKQRLEERVLLNIHKQSDKYSYYIEMVPDPSTMFELVKYGKTYGYIEVPNVTDQYTQLPSNMFTDMNSNSSTQLSTYGYRLKSNDVNVFQADDFVHAYLAENNTRFPEQISIFTTDEDYDANTNALTYQVNSGKSLLYDSYKTWREKQLLEMSAILNRVTRSSLVRTVQVEVGDMSKAQVQNTLRRVKDMMEQKVALNTDKSMSEYTNPGPIENNIYLATHGGQGAVTIGQIGGDFDPKQLTDLDWWNNKFYSSYGAGFNGGTSLTILSSEFAKGVKRIQNALVQALTDAVNLFLVNRGCASYVNNFVIKMKAPVTQEEVDGRSALTERISALSNFQSLLQDVEDKARRLTILKSMIHQITSDDEVIQQLQDEIEEAIENKEKQKADEANGGEGADLGGGNESPDLGGDAELPPAGAAAEESFFEKSGGQLLVEGPDFLNEDQDELPTPGELSDDITDNTLRNKGE